MQQLVANLLTGGDSHPTLRMLHENISSIMTILAEHMQLANQKSILVAKELSALPAGTPPPAGTPRLLTIPDSTILAVSHCTRIVSGLQLFEYLMKYTVNPPLGPEVLANFYQSTDSEYDRDHKVWTMVMSRNKAIFDVWLPTFVVAIIADNSDNVGKIINKINSLIGTEIKLDIEAIKNDFTIFCADYIDDAARTRLWPYLEPVIKCLIMYIWDQRKPYQEGPKGDIKYGNASFHPAIKIQKFAREHKITLRLAVPSPTQ